MAILDYEAKFERLKKHFFDNKSITQKSKKKVKEYLDAHSGTLSRKCIILEKIPSFLEHIKDIEKDIKDRNTINQIFKKIKTIKATKGKNKGKAISPSTIETIRNVAQAFATWVNEGDKPVGFKDQKGTGKAEQKRDLRAEDMLTWNDAKNLANVTPSIQLKAIILTQLDAGFRPSEFIDLNYGDVSIKKDVVVFHISKGKTGKRDVICQRCPPFFLRWYYSHPSKKKDSPLWIMEYAYKSHPKSTKSTKVIGVKRYNYFALQKRIKSFAKRINLEKPVDFYAFRHSSCVLDKKDNLPLDLAATRHGHSTKYFTDVYGRLDVDAIADRYRDHYDLKSKKEKAAQEKKKNVICERCDHINEPEADYCFKCGSPLNLNVALSQQQEADDKARQMVDSYFKDLIKEVGSKEMKKALHKVTLKELSKKPKMPSRLKS